MILVINSGSSSLRLKLFARGESTLVEEAQVHYRDVNTPTPSLLEDFMGSANSKGISMVVHRVVHGGALLGEPSLIDARVEQEIEKLIPLAPLHNSAALEWIRISRRLLGEALPQVAVFDTAFYQSMPQVAKHYALPQALCQQHHIRRYGFHGIAHSAMWERWCQRNPDTNGEMRVISVQLGSGCSVTAIDRGLAVDTSMGFSPLEGLVMATRCGDVDPMVMTYLQRQAGLSPAELERILNKKSGLLGISGESSDMQTLLASDSPDAALAIELYCYRVRKQIGAYLAVLGGTDAILFGGGVGENSPKIREKILHKMSGLGVGLDTGKNETSRAMEALISTADSAVEICVIPVDEASVMVKQALQVMNGDGVY